MKHVTQAWYYSSIGAILLDKGKGNSMLTEFGTELLELCRRIF